LEGIVLLENLYSLGFVDKYIMIAMLEKKDVLMKL
jgi:hypothetical protein